MTQQSRVIDPLQVVDKGLKKKTERSTGKREEARKRKFTKLCLQETLIHLRPIFSSTMRGIISK